MTIPKKFKEDWKNSPIQRTIIYIVVTISFITFFQKYFMIAFNATDSLPQKLFIIQKGNKETVRGKYYAFRFSKKSDYYTPETKFVKQLTGVPGDQIQTDSAERTLTLTGKKIPALGKDSNGKIVEEFFIFNGSIPEKKYFFTGEAKNSYDSRYWGFVNENDIIGRAYPLF